jgi:molybdenum-dependent DNA-binding transcriptional regulator ModE
MNKLPKILTKSYSAVASVIEHGSYNNAAKARGTSQPNITYLIKRIEIALGEKLFNKKGKGNTAKPNRLAFIVKKYSDKFDKLAIEMEKELYEAVNKSTPKLSLDELGSHQQNIAIKAVRERLSDKEILTIIKKKNIKFSSFGELESK